MPSWMLAAPGMALWPPPLIENLHSFSVKSATARETFSDASGEKMHPGLRNSVAAVLISKVIHLKKEKGGGVPYTRSCGSHSHRQVTYKYEHQPHILDGEDYTVK